MNTAIRTQARVFVAGVPPNWSNYHVHHMSKSRLVKVWRDKAWYAAQSARNEAGWWPLERVEKAPRWLEVDIFKVPPLYDPDGAVACLKPLVDALNGVLLVDDSEKWCRWLRMPEQHAVQRAIEEQVVLTVHLVDPR